ncbi:MAG: mechanosensitive ion channel family protein [Pseudomonadales bacterium]
MADAPALELSMLTDPASLIPWALDALGVLLPRLVLALLTLILGYWLINRGLRLSRRLMDLRKVEPSLSGFLVSLSGLSLKTLLLISVAGMLGVETTSFIAVLGAAGLAVGLALQGSLANFAGGVLVLMFKPFRVGHVIDSGATLGTVTEIGVLNTHLRTFDGRTAIIPNGQLANNPVINLSLEPLRRAEWLFTMAPTADGGTVLAHLRALVEGESRIVTEPPPLVAIAGFTELGVQYLVRGWVPADQLWPTTYEMNARIKATLDEAGLPLACFSEPLRTSAAP